MHQFYGSTSSTTEARTLAEVNSFPRKINPTILHSHERTQLPQVNLHDYFEKSKVVYISLNYNTSENHEEWICTSTFRDKHFYNVLSKVRPSTYKVLPPKHAIPTAEEFFVQKKEMQLLKEKIVSTPVAPVGPGTAESKAAKKRVINQRLPNNFYYDFFTTWEMVEPDQTATIVPKVAKKLLTNKKLPKNFVTTLDAV